MLGCYTTMLGLDCVLAPLRFLRGLVDAAGRAIVATLGVRSPRRARWGAA